VIRRIERQLRHLLLGPARGTTFSAASQRDAYLQAQWLARAFYIASLAVAFRLVRESYVAVFESPLTEPLWPVFWMRWVEPLAAARVIVLALVVSAMACVVAPASRLARVAFAVLFVEAVALRFSFGYFYHHYHIWLWLAVAFAVFPVETKWRRHQGMRPAHRHRSLTAFFYLQLLVGLFYSLSGLWKLVRGFVTPPGYMSTFAPDALPALVTERWLLNGYETPLQPFFIGHFWLGLPSQLFVVYVELFTLVAVFRPAMHRPFGVALMTFHFMVWLLMGIQFQFQPMMLALVFVFSPFASNAGSLLRNLRQLPLFGDLAFLLHQLVQRPRRGWKGSHRPDPAPR